MARVEVADKQRNAARESEVASVTAEYNPRQRAAYQVEAEVADITAHLADLRAQIASLDRQLNAVAIQIQDRHR